MPNQINAPVHAEAVHIPDGCTVEISDDLLTWTNLGVLIDDTTMEHTWDAVKFNAANIKNLLNYGKNHLLNAAFTIGELYADNIADISGGMYTLTNTAGTPVAGATQSVASGYDYDTFIPIANQNGDGSAITINSVTQDPSGTPTPLVLDTDYFKGFSNGIYGIWVKDTATSDNAFDFEIDYDYTPNASKKLTAGTSSITITPKALRFKHTDSNSKSRYMVVYSAIVQPGFTFTFGSAENEGIETIAITMQGDLDTSRADGDQLFAWYDEQAVS
jgi:hypothetical protein